MSQPRVRWLHRHRRPLGGESWWRSRQIGRHLSQPHRSTPAGCHRRPRQLPCPAPRDRSSIRIVGFGGCDGVPVGACRAARGRQWRCRVAAALCRHWLRRQHSVSRARHRGARSADHHDGSTCPHAQACAQVTAAQSESQHQYCPQASCGDPTHRRSLLPCSEGRSSTPAVAIGSSTEPRTVRLMGVGSEHRHYWHWETTYPLGGQALRRSASQCRGLRTSRRGQRR